MILQAKAVVIVDKIGENQVLTDMNRKRPVMRFFSTKNRTIS